MGRRLGNIITLVGRSELSLFNLSSVFFLGLRSLGLMVEKEKKTLYHTNLNTVLDY